MLLGLLRLGSVKPNIQCTGDLLMCEIGVLGWPFFRQYQKSLYKYSYSGKSIGTLVMKIDMLK
jgi:hypothetical protein